MMRSGQCPNGLLPVPLSRLGRGNEGVVVTNIHDARVSCDVRGSQEQMAALVGADRLEMTEGVAHEVDRRALAMLTAREREVISLRFGLVSDDPLTLDEVGRRFGLTRERIRQIEAKALARLKAERAAHSLRDFLD